MNWLKQLPGNHINKWHPAGRKCNGMTNTHKKTQNKQRRGNRCQNQKPKYKWRNMSEWVGEDSRWAAWIYYNGAICSATILTEQFVVDINLKLVTGVNFWPQWIVDIEWGISAMTHCTFSENSVNRFLINCISSSFSSWVSGFSRFPFVSLAGCGEEGVWRSMSNIYQHLLPLLTQRWWPCVCTCAFVCVGWGERFYWILLGDCDYLVLWLGQTLVLLHCDLESLLLCKSV